VTLNFNDDDADEYVSSGGILPQHLPIYIWYGFTWYYSAKAHVHKQIVQCIDEGIISNISKLTSQIN